MRLYVHCRETKQQIKWQQSPHGFRLHLVGENKQYRAYSYVRTWKSRSGAFPAFLGQFGPEATPERLTAAFAPRLPAGGRPGCRLAHRHVAAFHDNLLAARRKEKTDKGLHHGRAVSRIIIIQLTDDGVKMAAAGGHAGINKAAPVI